MSPAVVIDGSGPFYGSIPGAQILTGRHRILAKPTTQSFVQIQNTAQVRPPSHHVVRTTQNRGSVAKRGTNLPNQAQLRKSQLIRPQANKALRISHYQPQNIIQSPKYGLRGSTYIRPTITQNPQIKTTAHFGRPASAARPTHHRSTVHGRPGSRYTKGAFNSPKTNPFGRPGSFYPSQSLIGSKNPYGSYYPTTKKSHIGSTTINHSGRPSSYHRGSNKPLKYGAGRGRRPQDYLNRIKGNPLLASSSRHQPLGLDLASKVGSILNKQRNYRDPKATQDYLNRPKNFDFLSRKSGKSFDVNKAVNRIMNKVMG